MLAQRTATHALASELSGSHFLFGGAISSPISCTSRSGKKHRMAKRKNFAIGTKKSRTNETGALAERSRLARRHNPIHANGVAQSKRAAFRFQSSGEFTTSVSKRG